MNNVRRFLGILFLLVFISCQNEKKTNIDIEYIIAPEASIIIDLAFYTSLKDNLTKQPLLSKLDNKFIFRFWSLDSFNEILDVTDKSVLSINTLSKDKTIKTLSFDISNDIKFKLDTKEVYQYDGFDVSVFETSSSDIFYTSFGQKGVLSSSKIILENIIRNYQNEIENDEEINKLFNILSDKTPSIVIDTKKFPQISKQFIESQTLNEQLQLGDYIGFDVNIDDNKILLSGIIFEPTENASIWDKLTATEPISFDIANVIPANFINSTSILFNEYQDLLPKNTVGKSSIIDSLYINSQSLTHLKLSNGEAFILGTKDIDQTYDHLKIKAKPTKSISSINIHELFEAIILDVGVNDVLSKKRVQYFFAYDEHIIFSKNIEVLENYIIQINNNTILASQSHYKEHIESLSNKSHIVWLTNLENQTRFFDNNVEEPYKKELKSIAWETNQLLVSQFTADDGFGYFNVLQKKTSKTKSSTEIEQLARLKADNPIINQPRFFENWRTGQQDVVCQDSQNLLYLKDTKGNLIWEKQLDSPIIGSIENIDIYKNKRIQITFVTKDKIYLLDKNGNDVSPFPIKIKDEITQGLSVFDYDNNGKYRFVICTDNKVLMYDKNAKRVKGFKFKKSDESIAFPIKHFRIRNKDYILVQDILGKLYILDRQGKERIKLDKKFRNIDHDWLEYDDQFVSMNLNGELLKINQKGEISRKDMDMINPKFDATPKQLSIVYENKIYLNGKVTELPYGMYSKPIIRDNYIILSDSQSEKIYVLNDKAKILDGFPIYGKEISDVYVRGDHMIILSKDEENAILVYKVKLK